MVILRRRSGAPDGAAWAAAAATGVAAVRRYGGAAPGDRTMLDALLPATEALSSAVGGLPGDRKASVSRLDTCVADLFGLFRLDGPPIVHSIRASLALTNCPP